MTDTTAACRANEKRLGQEGEALGCPEEERGGEVFVGSLLQSTRQSARRVTGGEGRLAAMVDAEATRAEAEVMKCIVKPGAELCSAKS
jgi:hypothetical protein